jgi:hypothetical protein
MPVMPHTRLSHSVAAALWAVCSAATPAVAQVADRGVLVIRQGEREIGTERFETGGRAPGDSVNAKASYPALHPVTELTLTVVRGPSTTGWQLARSGPGESEQVFAVLTRNRLILRLVERGTERASELPANPATVLLADSLFAPYLQIVPLAGDAPRSLTAVFPQSGNRVSFTATGAADSSGTLIRLEGGLQGTIELGARGELLRISLPSRALEARRKPN